MSSMSDNKCLFVTLPDGDTISLKHLEGSINVQTLRATVELSGGIPAEISALQYVGKTLDEDVVLKFGDNIKSGALLRLVVKPKWNPFYTDLRSGARNLKRTLEKRNKPKEFLRNGSSSGDKRSWDVLSDATSFNNKMFVALFVAASKGNHDLCEMIIHKVPRTLKMATPFGRTALHACAACDQVRVTSLILSLGGNPGAADMFGESPLDVSLSYQSFSCHRILKNAQRRNLAVRAERSLERQNTFPHENETISSINTPSLEAEVDADNPPGKPVNSETNEEPSTIKKPPEHGEVRRTQSAPYYQTKYHIWAKQPHVYKARPATADSRFRFWKTWLVEKHEAEVQELQPEVKESRENRKRKNHMAFQLWLRRKSRENKLDVDPGESLKYNTESEGEEEEVKEEVEAFYRKHWPVMDNKTAYSMWLERKRQERREQVGGRSAQSPSLPPATGRGRDDRRVTCFEMGNTDSDDVTQDCVDTYIGCYGRWLDGKRTHEAWKSRNGENVKSEKTYSRREMDVYRWSLLQEGMTYEQWLGLKLKQQQL